SHSRDSNVIKNYGTEELIEYLRNKDLKHTETHFEIIREVMALKEAQQQTRKYHRESQKIKPNIPKSNTGLVSVFVDNSNLFIEGKYISLYRSWMSYINSTKRMRNQVIIGSRPAPNDSLWERICQQVVGDGNYSPILKRALDYNWKGCLLISRKDPLFTTWMTFTDIFQTRTGKIPQNYIFAITDGETFVKWKDDKVMECFISLELFGWWFRKVGQKGLTICLYFDNRANLKRVQNWMESNHSDLKVWEKLEKRKS
ncbi:25181_t:CDS:2, partial [Gigaspora margarita]